MNATESTEPPPAGTWQEVRNACERGVNCGYPFCKCFDEQKAHEGKWHSDWFAISGLRRAG